jgi:hypothetical protein
MKRYERSSMKSMLSRLSEAIMGVGLYWIHNLSVFYLCYAMLAPITGLPVSVWHIVGALMCWYGSVLLHDE